MDAGTIFVTIDANYSAFSKAVDEVESKVKDKATATAKSFSDKFGEYLERSKSQIGRKIEGFLNPIQIVNALGEGFKKFNETGDISAGLEASVKSIPLVGAAYELGTAAGTALANAFTEAGKAEVAADKAIKAMQEKANRAAMREGARVEEQQGVEAQIRQTADLERQLDIETARAAGNERTVAALESAQKVADLERQLASDLTASVSDEESSRLKANYDRRVQLESLALDAKYKKIEEAEEKVMEQAQKEEVNRVKREVDALHEVAKDREEREERWMKLENENNRVLLEDRRKQVDEEMAARQTVDAGQTAIGTFRFDPYSQSDKKRNDERMVTGIEKLAAQSWQGGGFV